MTTVELITHELHRLHKTLDKSLEGLTSEQLHQVPAGHPSANTIAWGLWHYARTEDNVVRYILQNRRPIVWAEGGYAEKLGLPPIAQGTGMTTQEAQGLRIKDLALFREYVARVWASTDDYLARRDACHSRARRGVPHARLHPRRRDRAGAHAGGREAGERRLGLQPTIADDLELGDRLEVLRAAGRSLDLDQPIESQDPALDAEGADNLGERYQCVVTATAADLPQHIDVTEV